MHGCSMRPLMSADRPCVKPEIECAGLGGVSVTQPLQSSQRNQYVITFMVAFNSSTGSYITVPCISNCCRLQLLPFIVAGTQLAYF